MDSSSLLRRLEIYGFPWDTEHVILSSLLTGENMLMIGSTGIAKTTLAKRLGTALSHVIADFKYGRFSAPNDNFDDLVGYVDVKKLSEGYLQYVPGATTLWDKQFVFVDELN